MFSYAPIAMIQSQAIVCWMARWFITSKRIEATPTTTHIVVRIAKMTFGIAFE
jgi:hypothetical protein